MTRFALFLALMAIPGCTAVQNAQPPVEDPSTQTAAGPTRPKARPATLKPPAPKPPVTARTEEQFDTTTAQERAEAAVAPEPAGEKRLGSVTVSLGDVTQPGFWLETGLVSAPAQGRVVFAATGKSAQVDLRPSAAGSRLSLAAMRLIEAPLTDLPTIEVFQSP